MGITNLIFLIVGLFVILIGAAAFLNPNLARLINVPGGPRLKAVVATIVGIILILVAFFYQI